MAAFWLWPYLFAVVCIGAAVVVPGYRQRQADKRNGLHALRRIWKEQA